VFAVEPQRVRFRMANIGTTYEMRVHLDGHRMTVIAVDGIPTAPSSVDSVTLDVGERCDVIVEMNQAVGNYWLRASTLDPRGQDGVRAIVRYAGAPVVELSILLRIGALSSTTTRCALTTAWRFRLPLLKGCTL
jgi:FtsP/CotA-like multicopper oxidase with cupredoxin domain